MPKPIYNKDLSAKAGLEGSVGGNQNPRVSARVNDRQGNRIFQQVNNNLGKNPNHSRGARQNNNPVRQQNNIPVQPQTNNRGKGVGNQTNAPVLPNKTQTQTPINPPNTRTGNNQEQNDQTQINNAQNEPLRRNNGTQNASQQGLLHGRGHHKTGGNNHVQINGNEHTAPNQGNTNNQPYITTIDLPTPPPRAKNDDTQTVNLPQRQPPEMPANNQTNLPNRILTKVLQHNDIYLGSDDIQLLNNSVVRPPGRQNFQTAVYYNNQTPQLPSEINNLVQSIADRVSVTLSCINQTNNKTIQHAVEEISQQFQQRIETVRDAFLQNTELCAKHFKHLNISERMETAIELMPPYLPADFADELQNFLPREVLSGLLLTRGFVAGQENTAELRNLIAFQPPVLPREITLSGLRDVGQFVKMLISDAAIAKSTANLDLAVQKFVRLLIANNELGVLLATVNLAAQTQDRGALVSRSLALVQIYELINRLLLAGEKALKNAMPEMTAKEALPKTAGREFLFVGGANGKDETASNFSKSHGGAETALRQFLEFNPAAAFDNSASVFHDSDDAQRAQKEFVSAYGDDIDRWLKSGNHRFVSEIDFEKPIGVVVERSRDDVFTASKVRVVLVRDGSVQGWHFLKSFLVR